MREESRKRLWSEAVPVGSALCERRLASGHAAYFICRLNMSQTSPWNIQGVSERVSELYKAQCFGLHAMETALVVCIWLKQNLFNGQSTLIFFCGSKSSQFNFCEDVHVQFATRTSICVCVEMSDSLHTDGSVNALNFCYDSWRMTACLTSASLSQVSSWSLFYPKLLHSQQALHLTTEGVL